MEVRDASAGYALQVDMPVVPEGYKQTEVGVIPEDWEVKKLGELANFRTGPFGSALHKSDYTTGCVPVINPMHIVGSKLKPTVTMTITEAAASKLFEFRLQHNDIVIGRRGDMGRCAVVSKNHAGWLCGTGSMIVRPSATINPDFLQRILTTSEVISKIENASVGSTMINLNQATLSNLYVQRPSLKEQRAIATALSDVDALLEALDRLIAKKRDIKQATMQQLLTAQTRLPGFAGHWEIKQLGELLTICHGRNQRDVEVKDGPFPILATGGKIGTAKQPLYAGPSVLIGRKGTINKPQYMAGPFWTVDTLFYSIIEGENKAKFLYYRLLMIDWMQYNEASGVPSLNARTIESIEIPCPEPAEQLAIAAVLSDMGTEIEALEQRRTKTAALKQAMMQELLTGRTRLVGLQVGAEAGE